MTPVLVALRSRHDLCETTRAHEQCDHCGSGPGVECVTTDPAVHLRRAACAHRDGWMSDTEFGSLIPDGFHPGTEILDGSAP